MYRPDDWKNPHTYGTDEEDYDIYAAYEAGADAMLEALKAKGQYWRHQHRWQVFIPEEE